MSKKKIYEVSDLFFTRWDQLTGKVHAAVYSLLLQLRETEKGTRQYGLLLISILRLLRKNPRLVEKINEEQAVDIFNDLTFLNEPWYYFYGIPLAGITPQAKLARHTFDHFIYADNEYSSFIATQDEKYLRRLVGTLYQDEFDKENVEPIASFLLDGKKLKIQEWQLSHTFFTYAQVREFVVKRCKTLMPTPPSTPEGEEPEPARPTGAMWLKLKHRLAETPAFQGYETAGRANMYAALDYLEDLAQQKVNAKP